MIARTVSKKILQNADNSCQGFNLEWFEMKSEIKNASDAYCYVAINAGWFFHKVLV